MARVYDGKTCVYESEDTADVLGHVVRMGGSARVKCCGLVFYPGYKGRWNQLAAHLAGHAPDDAPPPDSTPEPTTKTTRRSSAKRGSEGVATSTGDR